MTLSEIYFNYNEAVKGANRIDNIAQQLDKQSDDKIGEILLGVKAAWESDSSPQYLKKGQKVQKDIKTTAGNLRRIAVTIRNIAAQIRNAELEAWRVANERKKD